MGLHRISTIEVYLIDSLYARKGERAVLGGRCGRKGYVFVYIFPECAVRASVMYVDVGVMCISWYYVV